MIEQLATLDPAKTARLDEIPSKTALLDHIDRSSGMAQRRETTETVPATSPPPRRRGWLVAAAAFIAVIAVLGVVALVGGDEGLLQEPAAPATTAPATTATPTTEAADPLGEATAIVQTMVDNYNNGDVDLWLTSFTDDAEIYTDDVTHDAVPRQESLMVANSQWELFGCRENEIQFEGSYPTLACDLTLNDDFVGRFLSPSPFPVTYRFVIAESGGISQMVDTSVEWWIKQERFLTAFNEWLAAKHPDVAAGFQPRLHGGLPDAADMPTALEYVEEFVEQSDTYPLA